MTEKKTSKARALRSRPLRRAGFSLAEILVTLAITGVLTALLLVNVAGFREKTRIAKIEDTFLTLATAIREFDRQVGAWPEDLQVLVTKPTLTDKNICGTNFTQAQIDKWHGPYVGSLIPTSGIVIETDTIITQLKKKNSTPVTDANSGVLQIFLQNATLATAQRVEADLDGDGDLTDGRIMWVHVPAPVLLVDRLIYAVQISGC